MAYQRRSEERDGERERTVFSRSTAACNACRAKKQKCGGQRPVCARCRMLEQPCIWPQQKKRGPSKGYNEALEARLNETEQVLFRLLSCISSRQLSQALDGPPWPHSAGEAAGPVNFKASLQQGSIPRASALDREAALEYWTQFPLKTAADVQAWHKGRYESYSSLPLHADTLDDMDMDQNDDTTNSNQLSSSNDNSNAHRYDNNIHRGAARKEGAHPPSPETRKSRDKTAPTVQDVWGTFLHTSDGQYPPSSSRGTTTSRDTTLSPLPVGPAGIEPQGIPSARDSSIGYAGLGFSQEFQERFLW